MPDIRLFTTADPTSGLLMQIRDMLDDAFEGDFSDDDWEHSLGGWHVIVVDGGVVLSHASVVSRELQVADRSLHTGYVEAVATAPARQGEGHGVQVMVEVSDILRGHFEMGALSTGLPEFYAGVGWERWHGPTFVRHGPELIRTADDDDGVMVLRYGPSKDIDLAAPLTCQSRRGDDW